MASLYAISVVCTGNICRSPMGEVILREAVASAGLADHVRVVSAGTGDWHVGDGADHRAAAVMADHGMSLAEHHAAQFTAADFARVDLVLALDAGHETYLRRLAPSPADRDKVRLLRSFDPVSVADDDLEVADPYFGDRRDFEITYEQLRAAVPGILEHVRAALAVHATR
ncbi:MULTISPECIES: low molecular weight protein-tyrosine-phosphatase [unclassified Pseudactinotalea]|uniref:low molecular weight protein-tyrosine-phosphatase n=1 Tax=unclassified Pseudactinotalea TaxID=2649176 RepID=UPI00128E145A|nr:MULTISPECIES: low molecular weight protein-tyrosine-phosphatase [unclassified Pseudactinotalea]MPV50602.1 low molecular weight phosphotyrosine protein phosphatase [Pseudactinotalea sp. HY160]QGH70758.1 low molecular weight phosphotyrosine protein phosphatase [Pseudactinotalea sp. HY158]